MFDVNSPGLNERFIYRELPQLLAVSVFQHAVQVFSDGRGVCIKKHMYTCIAYICLLFYFVEYMYFQYLTTCCSHLPCCFVILSQTHLSMNEEETWHCQDFLFLLSHV